VGRTPDSPQLPTLQSDNSSSSGNLPEVLLMGEYVTNSDTWGIFQLISIQLKISR